MTKERLESLVKQLEENSDNFSAILEEVWQEGYDEGYSEGYDNGLEES